MAKLRPILGDAARSREYVWIYVRDRCFMGYVVGLGESLVLFHWFRDFTDNGFLLVRIEAITEVLYRERSLQFFQTMMTNEGLTLDLSPHFSLPLSSLTASLEAIREQRELVLVDRGSVEPLEAELHTGHLLAVDERHTTIRHLTAWGEWEGAPRVLENSQIERVEFGSPYLKTLQKYSAPPFSERPSA